MPSSGSIRQAFERALWPPLECSLVRQLFALPTLSVGRSVVLPFPALNTFQPEKRDAQTERSLPFLRLHLPRHYTLGSSRPISGFVYDWQQANGMHSRSYRTPVSRRNKGCPSSFERSGSVLGISKYCPSIVRGTFLARSRVHRAATWFASGSRTLTHLTKRITARTRCPDRSSIDDRDERKSLSSSADHADPRAMFSMKIADARRVLPRKRRQGSIPQDLELPLRGIAVSEGCIAAAGSKVSIDGPRIIACEGNALRSECWSS